MTNLSLTSPSPLNAGNEYYGANNQTVFCGNSHLIYQELEWYIVAILCMLISIPGLLGNGTVIWLLSFHIKRNPFTTYILNLSIADFGSLTANFILNIYLIVYWDDIGHLYTLFDGIFLFMYNAGQFLLIVISTDRCVSVLFPLWHRCHQPENLSATVCAILWVLSFFIPAINFTLSLLTGEVKYDIVNQYQYILNGFLCLPLMTISTLVLFVAVCFKSQQRRSGKLLIAILLTLLFFLLFSFPLNSIYIAYYVFNSPETCHAFYLYLCACLNSTVNPFTYFLIGRQKRAKVRKNMKAILQNVFKDEESPPEELEISPETQL